MIFERVIMPSKNKTILRLRIGWKGYEISVRDVKSNSLVWARRGPLTKSTITNKAEK